MSINSVLNDMDGTLNRAGVIPVVSTVTGAFMKYGIVALFIVCTSIFCGTPLYSTNLEHKIVYIYTEEDGGLIVTDLGLAGFIVDEWGDNSLDLLPQEGDVLKVIAEEDDDLWGFRHEPSDDMIYIYDLGFRDLIHHYIEKYNLKKEIIQIDDGTFYQIDYDGEEDVTSRWEQGQEV